ncbi:hypothetical protein B4U84_26130 [Westiellopsis prolifica IICB1]|nr:hypothetical protein B4U84_26130 [Westiellopsis prolifica IICB1]
MSNGFYSGGVHEIEIQRIKPDPEQPRQTFPLYQLQERAESLRRHGQKTPIVLIPQPQSEYILFDGELRFGLWTRRMVRVNYLRTKN